MFLLMALAPGRAAAQDVGASLDLFGDGALGRGGAFGAVPADVSSAWYNPGGLALGQRLSLTSSLTLPLFDRLTLSDGLTTAAGSRSVVFGDAASFPFFAGGAAQTGDRWDDGRQTHTFAAVTLTPTDVRRRFVGTLFLDGDGDGAASGLRVEQTDRIRWYGAAYSLRVLQQLGIGATVLFGTRTLRHEESQVDASGVDGGADGAGASQAVARISRLQIQAEYLLVRIGTLWAPTKHLRFGLTVGLPPLLVGARGRVEAVMAQAGDGDGFAQRVEVTELSVRAPLPFALRGSFSWEPTADVGASLDLILTGPLGGDDGVQVVDLSAAPSGPVPASGAYFAQRDRRDAVLDVAVGGSFRVSPLLIRTGLFTRLSPRGELPERADEYRIERIDRVGATFSVGVEVGGVDLNVGVVGVLGFGQALRTELDGAGALQGYVPTDANSQSVFLFVSGAGSGAQQIASDLYRTVGGDDAGGEEESESEEP